MKIYQECLREFDGLKEAEQSGYLVKHGAYLTTNAGTFVGIINNGATITTHSGTINTLFGLKDRSIIDMKNYKDEVTLCSSMMLSNYDFIDNRSLGNGDIILLAGINATSQNTTRTGPPSIAEGLKYIFVDDAGEIQIGYDFDKLAMGAIIITFTDPSVIVEKIGAMQIKVTVGPVEKPIVILIDLSTTIKTLIQHLTKGTEINSVVGLFNSNGLAPLASPAPVVVPR